MPISKSALRQRLRRVGRVVYWRLPHRWRDSLVEFSYRHAGRLFSGMGHYETWRRRREPTKSGPTGPERAGFSAAAEAMRLAAAADVDVVVVGVFDTLLAPLVAEPSHIDEIVVRRAGPLLGGAYARWRRPAERRLHGGAATLEDVFAELGRLARLDEVATGRLQALEVEVRSAALSPRIDGALLLRQALAAGKRVELRADGRLPRSVVETALARHGIVGWHALHLDDEPGWVGDAELSTPRDGRPTAAGPCARVDRHTAAPPVGGTRRALHLPSPRELARARPRLAPVIDAVDAEGALDAELVVGLIVRRFFAGEVPVARDAESMVPVADAQAIGYLIAGPLCVAFAQWLLERARADGVKRLHFLAREGQFLKTVYDRIAADVAEAPASSYLVVSRRLANVPAIAGADDVRAIARTDYGPLALDDFLRERFGLALAASELDALHRQGLWPKGRPVMIRDGRIAALEPLLAFLLPAILRRARAELPPLQAYLRDRCLWADGDCAVVDVGYSGTIQRRLNEVLGGGVHGYYMAADARTAALAESFGVRAEGCFHHRYTPGDAAPSFVRRSFLVEKLLSSDDPQVIRYRLENGRPVGEFRAQSMQERAAAPTRAAVRAGALAFVDDVRDVRERLLPDLRVPVGLALRLFEAFADRPSASEDEVLRELVLDDHYCGRGLVA